MIQNGELNALTEVQAITNFCAAAGAPHKTSIDIATAHTLIKR